MNTIVARLHEQRESPQKSIHTILKKGITIEELDWDRKTEETKIYKRLFLEKWEWKKDKKHKYLHITLNKENLAKAKKRKQKMIDNILTKYYDQLALSFIDHLLASTIVKLELGFLDKAKIIKTFGKAIEENSKKNKVVEINGQKRKAKKKDKAKTAKKPKKIKNKKRTN